MNYETPAQFRQALEARLATRAAETHTDLGRLRRRVVFERLLARLQHAGEGHWILKGGMALEMRIGDRARTTKDLDLTFREEAREPTPAHQALHAAVGADPFGDGFEFRVPPPRALEPDAAGRAGLRFTIDARLAGRTFAQVKVDVTARAEEITATERLASPTLLDFAGFPPLEIEVVDLRQHFAEKLHALTRDYDGHPSSRVRDLPDLLLLIHTGLEPDAALYESIEHLFEARATHPIPDELPQPPAGWERPYTRFAEELGLAEATVEQGMGTLRTFWDRVPRGGEN